MKQCNRIFVLMASSVLLACAQGDPPGRVGRLSFMTGDVSYRPGDVDDWIQADFNRPLTTGDHLWTDDGARAELHIGGTALRLNARTAFEFLNLDDNNVQIRLAEGSLSIHVRNLGDQEAFEVDTPNLAFSVLRPGEYRIDVDPDNQTTNITVRAGNGEVTGGGQAFTVRAQQQVLVSGGDSITYDVAGAPQPDQWDGWCMARNNREDQSPSARYVSRDMTGYQDLDDNGSWRQVPDYGAVWVPNAMAADWAPYHNGHWAWVEPWGWTWVDDAPWGFAPFHYGRWVYVGYWAWVPGPLAARPVYAPALVAWVGGASFGAAVSFGGGAGIAWFPLGPREVYVPAYNASPAYINRVNITNTTIVNNVNITNVYVNKTYINRSAPGAVTAVPQNAFASARPVQSVAVRVDARAIQPAQIVNTAAVAPSRQSVLGNSAPARASVKQPPAAIQNRPVVAKATPPPAAVPFAQRQQALSASPGRPLDQTQVQRLRAAQPAPARPMIRQAPAPANVSRPVTPANPGAPAARPASGGQNPPPVREDVRPPSRNDRPAPASPPANQSAPKPNNAPPPVQRAVPPPQNNVPPARPVEPPAAQPRQTPPPSRPVEPPPAQQPRQATPPARPPESPARKDVPKPTKKDEKKDKKDEKN
jgi:hypothetical protein